MGKLVADKQSPENPIQGETLNITRIWSWIAGGIGVLAPVIFSTLKLNDPQFRDQRAIALLAVAAVISAALLSVAVIVSADVRGRAGATAAKTNKQAAVQVPDKWAEAAKSFSDRVTTSLTGVAEEFARNQRIQMALPVGLAARTRDGAPDTRVAIIAIKWNPNTNKTEYLVGTPGAEPTWKDEAQLAGVFYERDPTAFYPRSP
jgi:hypothetical protein